MQATMQAEAPRYGRRTGILAVTWLVAYWAGRLILENPDRSLSVRLTAALVPVPIFAAFLWAYVMMVRTADELEQKIHLEALAIAFGLATLLLTTLALMQRAVTLSFQDWSYAHVWIYLPIFYFVSYGFIAKRYSDQ